MSISEQLGINSPAEFVITLVIGGGTLIVLLYAWFGWQARCPQCNIWRAMRTTGRVDKGRNKAEYKCRYCGHTTAKELESDISLGGE